MAQAIDPVCHMTVDTQTAQNKADYQGNTYYFCSPGCKNAFEKEPEKYTGGTQTASGHQH